MPAPRLTLAFFFALLLAAQTPESHDIFLRLKHALAGSGEEGAAIQALTKHDFQAVQAILTRQQSSPASTAPAPAHAELFSLQAAVAFLAGDMREAESYFAQAGQLSPLSDPDSFTLAMALVRSGDDQRASGLLAALSRKHPQQSLYVYWLGRIDYDLRRYPAAVANLQQAVAIDPQSARAWDSLGLAFDMQGQMDQAFAAFEKAVSLNRSLPHPSPWPPHNLGYWYLRMDQFQNAETALREAIRYAPDFAPAHYHLARTLEKLGRPEQAVNEYQQAVALDSTSPDACYSLALLYHRLHRPTESAAMFAEYKKRRESHPPSGPM